MARPGGFKSDQLAAVRTSVTAADSSTLTDANIDPTIAVDCRGFDTIWVGVEFVGGTGPTATFEILVRDADAADGSRWKRLLTGSVAGVTTIANANSRTTGALDGTSLAELRVDGRRAVFIRCTAITGAPTSLSVLATGGARRLVQNDIE